MSDNSYNNQDNGKERKKGGERESIIIIRIILIHCFSTKQESSLWIRLCCFLILFLEYINAFWTNVENNAITVTLLTQRKKSIGFTRQISDSIHPSIAEFATDVTKDFVSSSFFLSFFSISTLFFFFSIITKTWITHSDSKQASSSHLCVLTPGASSSWSFSFFLSSNHLLAKT